jgi:hypothetical protein
VSEGVENLQKPFELSSLQIEDAVNPLEVAAIFEHELASYVLIGGHMLSFCRELSDAPYSFLTRAACRYPISIATKALN